MSASVRQRLTNVAKLQRRPFGELLQRYALERWLYRLSRSPYHNKLILKGALLFAVWSAPATRPTRDIDLLAAVSNDLDSVLELIKQICQTQVEEDGLVFEDAAVKTERIAEDADYHGVRAIFRAKLGSARIPMRIDFGFSDVVTPAPETIVYPALLDFPVATLLAYNRESVIAEKFEAMIRLGELNSRMKDFFDVATLAAMFDFAGGRLAKAIQATFVRRQSLIQPDAICFSEGFGGDRARGDLWNAFLRRTHVESERTFAEVAADISAFLQPVAEALARRESFDRTWPPGGPWRPTELQ